MSNIGKTISRRRKELGMTQEELALKMGYKSKSTINKIELGINDIPQSKLVKFSEALDLPLDKLMGWDEKIKADPVGTGQLHAKMTMDKDFVELFEDFRKLDDKEKQIVKKFVHSMVEA